MKPHLKTTLARSSAASVARLRVHLGLAAILFSVACSQTANPRGPAAPSEAPGSPAHGSATAATPATGATATSTAQGTSAPKAIGVEPFGMLDGRAVTEFTLENERGLVLKVIDYGAIITELYVPDRDGKLADVVLGFEELKGYQDGSPYFGAVVGRVANRIRNATFDLAGKRYTLAANDAPHHLHGGRRGWDKVVWSAQPKQTPEGPALELTYLSRDGEEGYPGNVDAKTVYTLTHENELKVEMTATTDATTLVNMAQHTYWNLGGFDSGTIRDHELVIFAKHYTPGAGGLVPDGTIRAVEGTPFDFTAPKLIGKDLLAAGGDPIGFDHNWIVDGEAARLRPVARLTHPASGRVMTLEADKPGLQFYSGNFLDGSAKGKGARYPQYSGLCLETQYHPNSINVAGWRDSVVLDPGETYSHTMIHRFSTN